MDNMHHSPNNQTYYEFTKPIVKSQQAYLEILENTFNVFSNKYNKFIPYKMVNWQKEFHSYSINVLNDKYWKDRIVVKGRGISFSVSSMIDMIMSANKFDNIIIPIVSHRLDNAIDLIKVAQNLISNANIDFDVEKPFVRKEIVFKKSGSIIRAYPSSNQNALRQLRTRTCLLDEITFYRDIKGVFDAVESIVSEGGQITIGSTVYDRNNYFWELYQQQKVMKSKFVFSLPLFNPEQFNINESIIKQVGQGIKPLVWWQDLNKLEEKRLRDQHSFLRENMCTPSDEGVNFLSIEKILRNVDEKLVNNEVYHSTNPLMMGLDIASYKDYVGIVIFEVTNFGLVMRHCKAITEGIELPDLQNFIVNNYLKQWDITKLRVDMTGMGTQLAQFLRKLYGSKVEMIHFGQSVEGGLVGSGMKVLAGKNIKESIRDKMAWNMRYLFEDNKIRIINDNLLVKHLNSMSWDLKRCSSKEGHADLFWACALALLPLDYKHVRTPLSITSNKERMPLDNLPEVSVEW